MKKISITVIGFLFVALMGASNPLAASFDKDVYNCQQRLTELEYDPGPIDGFWGKKTRTAIEKFQVDRRLPVTGILDRETSLGKRDAGRIVRNSIDQMVFVLMCNGLAPF